MKKLIPFLCVLFSIGVGLGNLIEVDAFLIFLIALTCLVFFFLCAPEKRGSKAISLCFFFFFLGIWRYNFIKPIINEDHIAFYDQKEKRFSGQILSEPDSRPFQTKVIIGHLNFLNGPEKENKKVMGKILVNLNPYPPAKFGDWLDARCLIQKPGKINDFDYGQYLAVKKIYAVCYEPQQIKIISGPISYWQIKYRYLLEWKQKLKEVIDKKISYPQSEVLIAMTLGLRRGVPQEINENFSKTGVSHIISISGLHISIIVLLLMNSFLACGIKRRLAFILTSAFLLIFLLLIGFVASAARAGIMGWLILLGNETGRINKSARALMLAAAFLLFVNPKLLANDIGFQLSFLAMAGIVYCGEFWEKIFEKLRMPSWLGIKESLVMTCAAQIFVLPLIVYYFGTLSIIAPLANLLILPSLPLLMIFGFMTMFIGVIETNLAQIPAIPAELIMRWILEVADFFSAFRASALNIEKIHPAGIATIYALIIFIVFRKKFSWQKIKTFKINF